MPADLSEKRQMMQEKIQEKDRSEPLAAKETQIANTPKRYATSLVIREKQITIIRHHFSSVRLAKF